MSRAWLSASGYSFNSATISSDLRGEEELRSHETLLPRDSLCPRAPQGGIELACAKAAPGNFDLAKFGKIPMLVGGRVKPLDTVARNSLLIIHGKQTIGLTNGKQLGATPWLTDMLFNALVADQYPVFVIQNADVLGLFGWEQKDRKYFSYADFPPFKNKSTNRARSPRSCNRSNAPPIRMPFLTCAMDWPSYTSA